MTCNECRQARGKIIKMCEIFNAPCYDKYANIDRCKDRECKYFEPQESEDKE